MTSGHIPQPVRAPPPRTGTALLRDHSCTTHHTDFSTKISTEYGCLSKLQNPSAVLTATLAAGYFRVLKMAGLIVGFGHA